MRILIRLGCLILFATVGVGTAVYLAGRTPTSEQRQQLTVKGGSVRSNVGKAPALEHPSSVSQGWRSVHDRQTPSRAEQPPEPVTAPEPQFVAHHPRVAQEVHALPEPSNMGNNRRSVDVDTLVDVLRELRPMMTHPAPQLVQGPGPALTQPNVSPAPAQTSQLPDLQQVAPYQAAPQQGVQPAPTQSGDDMNSRPPPVLTSVPPAESVSIGKATPTAPQGEGDDSLEITFDNANLTDALKVLSRQAGINILASPSAGGDAAPKISTTLKDVSVFEALDAILKSTGYGWRRDGKFIYVGTQADFAIMQVAGDKIGTRVYRPDYIRASDLSLLITPILTPGVSKISINAPAKTGIATDMTNSGDNDYAEGEAVVIQDYESVLCEVDQIVLEIDKRPLQISIEAMIMSVVLNDANDIGVSWQVLRDDQHVRLGVGKPRVKNLDGSGVPDGTGGVVGEYTFTEGGLQFAFLDSSLGMFINALETIGDVSIVARPRLLCLNKQKAEILIGEQIGYLTNVLTETSTTQTVEFLNVGTQLLIRPYISFDGQIRMEVHPEISTGSVSADGVPSKTLTQVTTNVMCFDGCTVVIGGLMQEDLDQQISQVPLLGSTPIIGPMFRTKTDKIRRRELLVLLTPHIVYDPEYSKQSARENYEYLARNDTTEQQLTPLGHLSVSNRYLSKATDAFNAGDLRRARRWADLSVHFNASNREAVLLRNKLIGQGEDGFPLPGNGSLAAEVLEGDTIAPWVLEGLEGVAPGDVEGMVPPTTLHPRDPGIPGYHRDIVRPGVMEGARPNGK